MKSFEGWSDQLNTEILQQRKSHIFVAARNTPQHEVIELAHKMGFDSRLAALRLEVVVQNKKFIKYLVSPGNLAVLIKRLLEEIPDLAPAQEEPAFRAASSILLSIGIFLK